MDEFGTIKHDYFSFFLKALHEKNEQYHAELGKPKKRYDRREEFKINPKWRKAYGGTEK